jgi:hypothetical protein
MSSPTTRQLFYVFFCYTFFSAQLDTLCADRQFETAGFSRPDALLVSMGTGITNWIFAIPAIYTIDK